MANIPVTRRPLRSYERLERWIRDKHLYETPMRSLIPFALLLVVFGGSKDSAHAPPVVVPPPGVVVIPTDPCSAPARVVVTLDKKVLSVGEHTQARVLVYDSAGHPVQGCKVVWSAH